MSSSKINYSGPGAGAPINSSDPIEQSQLNTDFSQNKLNDPGATGSNDMRYYLQLQQQMLKEQQAYQALSTIMKARFDSATTAIRNFK
ncbi:MAG: hypothetical protein HYX75_06700 [Acidobacteria bacterium]|nr:hypothetical protein [Acidobacteriota bacterium]